MSPSSSALGTSAATESTTMMSTAFERISVFGDFEGLFAVVRLRDEQVVHIHAQLARIDRIERVFRVDECGLAAELLRFGDHVQRERRLAARFRAVDFDYAAAREIRRRPELRRWRSSRWESHSPGRARRGFPSA